MRLTLYETKQATMAEKLKLEMNNSVQEPFTHHIDNISNVVLDQKCILGSHN